ncbi:MAG: hypothetical protein EA397_03815 [Deltaproteobacteria bacterium]|nr:MAG: hypothetical protein EA397_03815 [Deltaproteobacteria bacterium]
MAGGASKVENDEVDPLVASLRRERAVLVLYPLFFLSGATGLTYQTLWARQLHLVFGTSTFAITTVLTAYMAGLAIGGFAMARYADRILRPMAAYGWIEAGIGLYALLFPALVGLATPLYLGLWRLAEPPPVLFGVLQFLVIGLLLLLPTALMGATLPLLARFATDRVSAAGDAVGRLYGLNTAGAVAGTFLCGFFLLPGIGLWWTTVLAAATNLALAGAALWAQHMARGAEGAAPDEDLSDPTFDPNLAIVGLATGLAGFSALTYEIAWTRVLGLVLGASVYAFSLMLLAFLLGIAIGGWGGGWASDRLLRGFGQRGLLVSLAALQVGVGLMSYGLLLLFPELPFLYVQLFDLFDAERSPALLWSVSMVVAVAVMTPPAVLMGASFPVAVRAVIGSGDALGGPVGRIYGFNTLGSLLGAGLAGFLFLPWIEIRGTVLLAVLVNFGAAVALLGWVAWSRKTRAEIPMVAGVSLLSVALVGVALWPASIEQAQRRQLLMTAGMYKYVSDLSERSREGVLRYTVEPYELLFYREGLSSVVTVARNKRTSNVWLANNGKVEASTTVDMPTQVLVSLLPFLFAEEREKALVIGLASGITAGSVTRIPEVEELTIVELEPAIERAARYFDEQNHGVLDDPRTRLIFNDGRNHLLLTSPASYDVIISEPSNPWISGVSNLFTQEFLAMGRRRLRPGGVWAQWVQMYGMGEDDLCSLLVTFADAYPHVALFMTVEDADLVMLGSERELLPDLERVRRVLGSEPGLSQELGRVGLDEPIALLSAWQMDREGIYQMCPKTRRNTDDNMRIEYAAPLNLHKATTRRNVERLLEFAQIPPQVRGVDDLIRLAGAYLWRKDFDRGLEALLLAMEHSEDEQAVALASRAREAWDGSAGWEPALRLAIRGGERLASEREELGQPWARWRVAMLRYLGEDVPEALLERARIRRDLDEDGDPTYELLRDPG